MNYHKTLLPNKLRLITVPMPSLESVTITVWVKVGSRYEDNNVAGISHFLEHIVFKGSPKRTSAQAISEAVDSIGGEFNAGTSKEWTNFYIRCRSATADIAMDVLSDMVLRPLMKQEDIDRERGVILEEISLYEDTPTAKIGEIFEQLIFSGNNLGRDIIGTRDTVKSVGRDDFDIHRNTFYYSENMLLTIAGGISKEKSEELALKYFGDLEPKSKSQGRPFDKFSFKSNTDSIKISKQQREQAHFIIGFPGDKLDSKERYVYSVLRSVLGGGMSSRLVTEVREKRGLAYSVRTHAERYEDTGYISTYAGVDPNKIDEAIKVILEQVYGLAQGNLPISQKELEKAKEYIKGHFALSLEDTRSVNDFFGEEELILGKVRKPDEVIADIDAVSAEQIQELAKKVFVSKSAKLAIIGPYDDAKNFDLN